MRKLEQFGAELSERHAVLVEKTASEFYRRHPELNTRYGAAGRQRCQEDIAYHFGTLAESLRANDPNILLKYVAWGKSLLANRKVKTDDLVDCLLVMQEVIARIVSEPAAEAANEHIQLALDTFDSFAEVPPSCIDPGTSMANIANSYLESLLSSDPEQARKVIRSAWLSGIGFTEIYQYVFQPSQREVGRMWQVNQITVAQEHYCTATTEKLMSEVYAQRPPSGSVSKFFVGACVAGEQHAMGIRMVTETMEANGWRVYLTGANTPTASIVDMVRRLQVHVLGISCSTVLHLAALRELIAAVRAAGRSTQVMVGGRIFCEFPGLWKRVGADGFAEDASSAVRVAAKLAGLRTRASVTA